MHCFDDEEFESPKIIGKLAKPECFVAICSGNIHSLLALLLAPFQNGQERETKVFYPRGYKRKSRKGAPFYDFAVLYLERPVKMPYADTIDICGTDVIGKNADLIMDEYEVVIMGLGYLWWTPNDDYELPDKLQEARASIVDPYHCQYKSMICLIGFGQSGLCYGIWVTSPLRRYLLITNSKISIKGNYRKMIFQATVELQQF